MNTEYLWIRREMSPNLFGGEGKSDGKEEGFVWDRQDMEVGKLLAFFPTF